MQNKILAMTASLFITGGRRLRTLAEAGFSPLCRRFRLHRFKKVSGTICGQMVTSKVSMVC